MLISCTGSPKAGQNPSEVLIQVPDERKESLLWSAGCTFTNTAQRVVVSAARSCCSLLFYLLPKTFTAKPFSIWLAPSLYGLIPTGLCLCGTLQGFCQAISPASWGISEQQIFPLAYKPFHPVPVSLGSCWGGTLFHLSDHYHRQILHPVLVWRKFLRGCSDMVSLVTALWAQQFSCCVTHFIVHLFSSRINNSSLRILWSAVRSLLKSRQAMSSALSVFAELNVLPQKTDCFTYSKYMLDGCSFWKENLFP